jgi:hypothetical protein
MSKVESRTNLTLSQLAIHREAQVLDARFGSALASLGGIPPLKEIFGEELRSSAIPETVARSILGGQYGEFSVWPIFLDQGRRGVAGAVFNRDGMSQQFPDYARARGSCALSAIAEACRNVAQHGRVEDHLIERGHVRFAPGAIFLREFSCGHELGEDHRFLLCMVSDEGCGIRNPARSVIPGVGSVAGENHQGMGYELSDSVLMCIKSSERRWFLFDGLHYSETPAAQSSPEYPCLAELQLGSPSRGCQKIFVFQHPDSNAEAIYRTVLDIVRPLTL